MERIAMRKLSYQLTVLLFTALITAYPMARGFKLYLTDGSYQVVREYEVQGDRVRYYSLERSAWEELPKDLIDLEATEKGREEDKLRKEKEFQEAARIAAARPRLPKTQGFEVQAGVILPPLDGVFVYDGRRVTQLIQNAAEVSGDKKRGVLGAVLPLPVLRKRAFVALPEPHAALRILSPTPMIYLRFAEFETIHFVLIELISKKKTRRVEVVTVGPLGGKQKESRRPIPAELRKITDGIYRLQPKEPLAPGEYAVAEILKENQLNIDVWDFGIDDFAKAREEQKGALETTLKEAAASSHPH